jgi:hypothetical protein
MRRIEDMAKAQSTFRIYREDFGMTFTEASWLAVQSKFGSWLYKFREWCGRAPAVTGGDFHIVDEVFDLELPTGEKIVLLSYARHAHADGAESFPGNDLIMSETGLKETAVNDNRLALERRGLLVLTSPNKKGGRAKSSHYRIGRERFSEYRKASAGEGNPPLNGTFADDGNPPLNGTFTGNPPFNETNPPSAERNPPFNETNPPLNGTESVRNLSGNLSTNLPDGWLDSFSAKLGKSPSKEQHRQVQALIEQDGSAKFQDIAERFLNRPEGFDKLKQPWSMFFREYPLFKKQHEQDQPFPELNAAEFEAARQSLLSTYMTLDATYYADKLADAKADYEANGALFDEPTRAEMLAQIEEYEAKLNELSTKEGITP